jgi:hypothetical protein
MKTKLINYKKALHIVVVISSYLPFIGIIWASNKQMKNKLYALWYWFISMIGGIIIFAKLAIYFNWI